LPDLRYVTHYDESDSVDPPQGTPLPLLGRKASTFKVGDHRIKVKAAGLLQGVEFRLRFISRRQTLRGEREVIGDANFDAALGG